MENLRADIRILRHAFHFRSFFDIMDAPDSKPQGKCRKTRRKLWKKRQRACAPSDSYTSVR